MIKRVSDVISHPLRHHNRHHDRQKECHVIRYLDHDDGEGDGQSRHSSEERSGSYECHCSRIDPMPERVLWNTTVKINQQTTDHSPVQSTDEQHRDDDSAGHCAARRPAGEHEVDGKDAEQTGVVELEVSSTGVQQLQRPVTVYVQKTGHFVVLSVVRFDSVADRWFLAPVVLDVAVDLVFATVLWTTLDALFHTAMLVNVYIDNGFSDWEGGC